jgi:hypothetical protein
MYSVHDGKLLAAVIHSCFPIFNLPHTLNKMHMNETLDLLIKEIAETKLEIPALVTVDEFGFGTLRELPLLMYISLFLKSEKAQHNAVSYF